MKGRQALYSIGFFAMAYWAVFWLFNGLDKFFNRTAMIGFDWYGNHRDEKFTMYFDRLGLSADGVVPTLMFAGIWELLAAGMCVIAMLSIWQGAPMREKMEKVNQAILITLFTFLGFCMFDVVVGDRAELLEHSTYIGVAIVSYIVVALEPVFMELQKQLMDGEEQEGQRYQPSGRNDLEDFVQDTQQDQPVRPQAPAMSLRGRFKKLAGSR